MLSDTESWCELLMTSWNVCYGALLSDLVHDTVVIYCRKACPCLVCLAVQAVVQFPFDQIRQRISCTCWTVQVDFAW